MSVSSKHVIFYCDDCDLLEPVISVFRSAQAGITVHTISDLDALLLSVRTAKPEMILMYLHDPKKSYVELLKQIREHVNFSTIEVIIYRVLPDNKDLEESFKKSFSKKVR